jgi:glycerol-3-phosphate cytidylyltransferase
VGYAPGVYDLFHIGHLNILRHARSRCDRLVAGVVSDELATLAKGRRPVVPLVERLEIVRSIRYVDDAFVETVPDKVAAWRRLRFDVLFKGDDWRGTPKGDRLERDLGAVGVEIVYLPYTVHTSSTQLRGALAALAALEGREGRESADSSRNHRTENAAQHST